MKSAGSPARWGASSRGQRLVVALTVILAVALGGGAAFGQRSFVRLVGHDGCGHMGYAGYDNSCVNPMPSCGGYEGYGALPSTPSCEPADFRPRAGLSVAPGAPRTGVPALLRASRSSGSTPDMSYSWDVNGDGTYGDATGYSVQHTFATSGQHVVGLLVTDGDGRTARDTRTIDVHDANIPPFAEISGPTATYSGRQFTLEASASDRDGRVVDYRWDLDGSGRFATDTGATRSVALTLGTAGVHTVAVRAVDDAGAAASASMTITVRAESAPPSVTGITVTPLMPRVGQSVALRARVSAPDTTVTSAAWDLDGNGTYETVPSQPTAPVTTAFGSPGDHLVVARVEDSSGATASQVTHVVVHAGNVVPVVRISAPGAAHQNTSFGMFASGLDPDGALADFTWNLEGAGFSGPTGASASTSFASAGEHVIRVRGIDDSGATAVASRTINITSANHAPTFEGGIVLHTNAPRPGASFALSAFAHDPDSDHVTYTWDLNDDRIYGDATGARTGARFADAGDHTVSVRAVDPFGGNATITRTVMVSPASGTLLPQGDITAQPVAPRAGRSVALTVTARANTGSVTAISWDLNNDGTFGDAAGANASFTFATAADHTVRARITNSGGGTSILRTVIPVHAGNTAPEVTGIRMAPSRAIAGQSASFTAGARDRDGTIASYAWDLTGNGQFTDATGATAGTTFTSGEHVVGVRVTDNDGATATHRIAVQVAPAGSPRLGPAVSITSRTTVEPGASFSVTAQYDSPDTATISDYAWDLDGDNTYEVSGSSLRTRTLSLGALGLHRVNLRVTSSLGTAYASRLINVVNLPPPVPAVSLGWTPSFPVAGLTTTLRQSSSIASGSIASRAWDLDGSGTFSTPGLSTVTRVFGQPGQVTVGARAVSARGTSATVTRQIPVVGSPLPVSLSLSAESGRVGVPVPLSAYISGALSTAAFSWDLNGDGAFGDASGARSQATFDSPGPHLVGVQVTNASGQTATERTDIPVAGAPPVITASATPAHPIAGQNIGLSADVTGGSGDTGWDLDDDRRYNDSRGAGTTVNFDNPGTYIVGARALTSSGDAANSHVSITVEPGAGPVSAFRFWPLYPKAGQSVRINTHSTAPGGPSTIASQQWDLNGDGTYGDASGPSVTTSFATNGRHTVGLKLTDTSGRTSHITHVIFVRRTASGPAASTPVAQPVPKARPGKLRVRGGTLFVTRNLVWIKVRCPKGPAACTGRIQILERPVKRARKARRKAKVKPLTVFASRRFRVAAGKSTRLRLKLTRRAVRTLKKKHKVRVFIAVTPTGSTKATRTAAVLKPKPKKKNKTKHRRR